jgi:hypothetical protein
MDGGLTFSSVSMASGADIGSGTFGRVNRLRRLSHNGTASNSSVVARQQMTPNLRRKRRVDLLFDLR